MIYFILHNKLIKVAIEYINSLINNINNSAVIFYPTNNLIINDNDYYIFVGLAYVIYPIFNKKNVYYLNIEQLTINGTHTKRDLLSPIIKFKEKNNNIKLLDYSLANIEILKKYNITSQYFPYQYNNNEIFNYDKNIDSVICCTIGSRAICLFENLNKLIPNSIYIGRPPLWGQERDNILFKSKILINFHHIEKEYNILEEIRITRCIFNKIIIISEYSENYHFYPLHKYIIFCEYENLINKAKEVLDNYDDYYNTIYKDFDIDKNNKLLKDFLFF
jgi:hypothetical protein